MGLLLAAVSYRYRPAEEILRPFMVFCKAVPVAVFAVLLLIWWGASPLAVAVCFLVVFPNIYLNTLEGLKSADAELIEMAEVFRLPFVTRFFYIYRPALKPFLLSAFQLSLGRAGNPVWQLEVIGHAGAFHRRGTVSGEDLPRYGGSVCLDGSDHCAQCIV